MPKYGTVSQVLLQLVVARARLLNADKLHWIKIFTTVQRYVQENEFGSFEVYYITVERSLCQKKAL